MSDFHVDAESGCVLDEVLAVAAIDPHLADAGVFGGDLVQDLGAGDGHRSSVSVLFDLLTQIIIVAFDMRSVSPNTES